MLLLRCPYCGERAEIEFVCGGPAHVVRPDPTASDDAIWAQYLYYRTNPKGALAERWLHARGCRRWFNLVRDTVTHEITHVYPMGDPRP